MKVPFYLLTRVCLEGFDHIPKDGPYLLVFNHLSIFDPAFLLGFWPDPPEVLGALETWNKPREAWAFRAYGGIVVDRRNYSRKSVDKVVEVLKGGGKLLMSPEGRISRVPGMQVAKTGVGFVLDRIDVPLVPVGLTGTTMDLLKNILNLKRPTISMTVGTPFHVRVENKESYTRKAYYQRIADTIMVEISKLLPVSYHGYYRNFKFEMEE